jgi:phospholipid-transporting ATPase
VLFLGAENEEGTCYIETMQLDGETNLKIKKAVDHTKHHNQHTLGGFLGTVHCEPPNSRLYTFVGNLETFESVDAQPAVVSLGPASVLLRGCSLRNTNRVFGLVIYAGEQQERWQLSAAAAVRGVGQ